HGDSVEVEAPLFWNIRANTQFIKGAKADKQKISHKDFQPAYMPMLVNDIVAAKRFLDEQNNAKVCNSSNLILIGAEEGAALGMLWASTEWNHRRFVPGPLGRPIPKMPPEFEGEDLACAIWLSATASTSKGGGFHVQSAVGGPMNKKLREKVPMLFFYGD